MADIESVDAALDEIVARLASLEQGTRAKIPNITVSVWIRDLDIAFSGRFDGGAFLDVGHIDPGEVVKAALRLTLTSDDFIDLAQDRLSFGAGWAKGRIKVDARFRDLLALRRFL